MAQADRIMAQSVRHVDRELTLERLTRVGFVAKGFVYVFVGVLALMAALGSGGETTDQKGVITRVASQPFGEVAVAVLGVGLLAYAAWRFLCAVTDSEHEGSGAKAIAKRIGYFASGAIHASLGIYAIRLLLSDNTTRGGDGTQAWSARLLSAPGGQMLLAAIGIVIIVAGLYMIRDGWKEKFRKHLGGESVQDWVITAGKLGYIARGTVFSVLGLLVTGAALRHDPSQVQGSERALDTLAAQPYGSLLLALVAVGLACYGAFCFVQARYRRVQV